MLIVFSLLLIAVQHGVANGGYKLLPTNVALHAWAGPQFCRKWLSY